MFYKYNIIDRPYQLWGPPSLLFNGYGVFPRI